MASLHVAVPPAGSAEPTRTPVAALGSVAANGDAFTVVVLGASGDLAHKKTYPSLFELFVSGLLPRNLIVVGFARSPIADAEFREKIKPSLKGGSPKQVEDFLALCIYRHGGYDDEAAFRRVAEEIAPREAAASQTGAVNRLFYFAVPPTVFVPAAKSIHAAALSAAGWNRIVIEKPFGKDLASSNALSAELGKYFSEEQIYRIDHYLGKEMVQNLFVLRFANAVFEPLWNRHHISNIQITFKEPFGTDGRGGYFDEFGIIRDVMQNHLLQVLSLVAMEPPVSASAEDIRDEKVKVLRCAAPVDPSQVVLGQFGPSAAGDKKGYLQEKGVPEDSLTPTFATAVLHVNNARWKGVPFILKCGKALNERKAEIRIQFKEPSSGLFAVSPAAHGMRSPDGPLRDRANSTDGAAGAGASSCTVGVGQTPVCGVGRGVHNNELVIRIQPNEAVYLKMMSKMPGLDFDPVETELDLSYKSRYASRPPPEAYARLLLDVLRGDQSQFVRSDELSAAWQLFTPLLHHIEAARVRPLVYPFGSRGPPQSDMLVRRAGYVYESHYASEWRRSQDPSSAASVLAAVERDFALPPERLRVILAAFLSEMRLGAAREGGSTIRMIPAYVTELPTGKEVGAAWAVDMGGTNLRVVEVSMRGDGALTHEDRVKKRIPAEMQAAPGPVLFDYIAASMKEAGMPEGAVVGFTFSYPTRQRAINAGELIEWTKGFTSEGVEGSNVVRLLEEACARAGLSVRITALVNDTVGTLMTTAYSDPRCRIGVIIGTGSNAAYVERADRIPKWTGPREGTMVINMEWGSFGSGADKTMLPFTAADDELDAHSTHPGKQRYEKMISGLYLGELVRLLLRTLMSNGAVFVTDSSSGSGAAAGGAGAGSATMASPLPGAADAVAAAAAAAAAGGAGAGSLSPSAEAGGSGKRGGGSSGVSVGRVLDTPEVFETAYLSDICVDETPALAVVDRVLRAIGIEGASQGDRAIVKRVCTLVSRRAARLAAMGVAGCVTQMGNSGAVSAGIDGSVFKKHPLVRTWMREALSDLGVDCELHEAEDGSGRGAAIVAVTGAKVLGL